MQPCVGGGGGGRGNFTDILSMGSHAPGPLTQYNKGGHIGILQLGKL